MGAWISGGHTPHYQKVMGFIDGSNFLIELGKELDVALRADKPNIHALEMAQLLTNRFFPQIVIRKYWFASYQGSEADCKPYAKKLRELGFEPVLFKKNDGKEKGVDIALATEMLVNAFNQNYDLGIIIAGDKDYMGLVKEVKRYGPIITGAFFEHGLSDDLALALDKYDNIMDKVNFNKEPWKPLIDKITNSLPKNKKL